MAGQPGKILLALIIFVTTGITSTEELESTLPPCASGNSPCDYQHHIRCSQGARISVTGARQKFSFGLGHCIGQSFTCSHHCCTGCTLTASRDALLSLKQHCDGKQNCTVSVPRKHVTCGLISKDDFYSPESTVTFDCITDDTPTMETRVPTSQSTTKSPEGSSVSLQDTSGTESSTPQDATDSDSSDVTTEVGTSSLTDTVEMTSQTPDGRRDSLSGGPGKGDNSSPTTPKQNTAAIAGGVVAGAIILAAMCIFIFVWWRRRGSSIFEKTHPEPRNNSPDSQLPMEALETQRADNAAFDADGEMSSRDDDTETEYDHLGAKRTKRVTPHDVTYGHLETSVDDPDADCYDHTRRANNSEVVHNVYDSACRDVTTEEDTYDHTRTASRGDVINDLYDATIPEVTSNYDAEDTYAHTRTEGRERLPQSDNDVPVPEDEEQCLYENYDYVESTS